MKVFRITNRKHASHISGIGASLYPGRWNVKGTPVLYTGESPEIALLENIVHIPPMLIPNLDILTLRIPNNSITELKISDLPKNWSHYPAPTILAEIGEEWIREGRSIALKVPSCVIHTSYNFILNCSHPDYGKVEVVDQRTFHFDARLSS